MFKAQASATKLTTEYKKTERQLLHVCMNAAFTGLVDPVQ